MSRFLAKRVASLLVTLWLLATIVFAMVSVLPGNVGRQVFGALAPETEVRAYNHKIGTDQPLIRQYGRLMRQVATLDFGKSYGSGTSVNRLIFPALFRSGKLAVLALIFTIPLAIAAGVFAARRQGRFSDRAVVMAGLGSSSLPDFVPATILVLVFCVTFKVGKAFATPPAHTSIVGQFRYLWTPAVAMAIVYFGYIARMTRAGVINALRSDYVRTADLKGLSKATVMRRHILRNALAPTITVISVQVGYLFGGLIGVEKVFNYQGLGLTILTAVAKHDIPVLVGAVLLVGIIYMVATLLADIAIALLNPRVRLGGGS